MDPADTCHQDLPNAMPAQPTELDDLVRRCGELYSQPTVVRCLLELIANPSADVTLLQTTIECDPALAAKVVRVVNASLFGVSPQVADLAQALALLGAKPLRLLLLGFHLPAAIACPATVDVLLRYWRIARTRAAAARSIAEEFWTLPGDAVYLSGLLDDIGQLVMIQELGAPYAELVRAIPLWSEQLLASEQAQFGFNHVQLTLRLLSEWKMPAELLDAVAAPRGRSLAHDAGAVEKIGQLARLAAIAAIERRPEISASFVHLANKHRDIPKEQAEEFLEKLGEWSADLAIAQAQELADGAEAAQLQASAREQLILAAAESAGDLLKMQCLPEGRNQNPDLRLLREMRTLCDEAALATKTCGTTTKRGHGGHAPFAGRRVARGLDPSCAAGRSSDLDLAFLRQLHAAILTSRQTGQSLSLLLVEIDRYAELNFDHGFPQAKQLLDRLAAICHELDPQRAKVTQLRDAQFAIILAVCDRAHAIGMATAVSRKFRGACAVDVNVPATVSIGVVSVPLPARDLRAEKIFERAERCLASARLSGGDSVKSIELC